jgi:hypothetical protein
LCFDVLNVVACAFAFKDAKLTTAVAVDMVSVQALYICIGVIV